MENNPDLKFISIHKAIREHFDFLFNRGFRITAVVFTDEGSESWVVTMLNGDWFIKLYCNQGYVNLAFTNLQVVDETGFLDLDDALEFMGNGNHGFYTDGTKYPNEHEQVKTIAHLFKRNFNELITQFDNLKPVILKQEATSPTYSENGRLSMDDLPFLFPE